MLIDVAGALPACTFTQDATDGPFDRPLALSPFICLPFIDIFACLFHCAISFVVVSLCSFLAYLHAHN